MAGALQFNSEVKAVYLNGTQVPIVDGTFNWDGGGFTREAKMGGGRVLGHTEAAMAGSCTFSVAFVKGTSLSTYDFKGGQIRVVWNTGDQMVMKNAASVETIKGAAPDGNLDLSYSGEPWATL
jgi:hypothetical protein